jgi:hypothetical protein
MADSAAMVCFPSTLQCATGLHVRLETEEMFSRYFLGFLATSWWSLIAWSAVGGLGWWLIGGLELNGAGFMRLADALRFSVADR